MLNKLTKTFFVFTIIVLLIACGDKSTESEKTDDENNNANSELRIATPVSPQGLDPHNTRSIVTTDIMWHVYETLVVIDSDFNIQPMLAESFEQSEDGKTITFYLRKGVLFHNGEEMTAEDVVASMNRWKELTTDGRNLFSDASFNEIDDYTVELVLPEVNMSALIGLAFPNSSYAAIMPKDIIENADDEDAIGVDEYIGTGPYQFVEWKQDQHVLLSKFDDYQSRDENPDGMAGAKEALIDDLYFIFTPDSSTQLAGIQTGEYDISVDTNHNNAEQLEQDPDIDNYTFPDAQFVVNFNKKNGVFSDVKMRQAVAKALNMEDILKGAYVNDNYYNLNHNIMMEHQHTQWYSDIGKDQYNQQNMEEAKKLLEEAGYDGEEIIFITTRDYEDHYNGSVVIQGQLEELGLNINSQVYDWPTRLDMAAQETGWDMYAGGFSVTPDPSLGLYLEPNYAGFTDSPEMGDILTEYRSQLSVEEAKPAYDKLQTWFYEYLPIVKVGDSSGIISVRSNVKNYDVQNKQNRPMFWNISVED